MGRSVPLRQDVEEPWPKQWIIATGTACITHVLRKYHLGDANVN